MSNNEFAEYTNLLKNIYESIRKENPIISILCGDFNARSPLFWEGDVENKEGRLFNNPLISNHLVQFINEPTYVTDDGPYLALILFARTNRSHLWKLVCYHLWIRILSIILYMVN